MSAARTGDFVHELDWIVGEVLQILDELKIADNTLVIFTSDNGGMLNVTGQEAWKAGHRLNGKLLGFKFGAWEGGHRVPFLARWPAKIPNGKESDALISQIDLLPTFAALANAKLPEDAVIDGVNQLPLLTGKSKKSQREMLVISPNSPKHLTIRKDDWVYIPAQDEGGFQGKNIGDHLLAGAAAQKLTQLVNSDVTEAKIKEDAPPAQLYDLKTDPYQARNVHNERPEVVAELSSLLEKWRRRFPTLHGWVGSTSSKADNPLTKAEKASPTRLPRYLLEQANEAFPGLRVGKARTVENHPGKIRKPDRKPDAFFSWKTRLQQAGRTLPDHLGTGTGSQEGIGLANRRRHLALLHSRGRKNDLPVGGGNGPATYVALCTEDGKEVETARGINHQVMQKASWDMKKYAGRKVFIKIVDQSKAGWGPSTADHFQFDGKLLKQYFKNSVH